MEVGRLLWDVVEIQYTLDRRYVVQFSESSFKDRILHTNLLVDPAEFGMRRTLWSEAVSQPRCLSQRMSCFLLNGRELLRDHKIFF